jgi:hypothetical protein
MTTVRIATFESKTGDNVEVFRGIDEETRAKIYKGASDPGIVRMLGEKDLKRFSQDRFPVWYAKGGGRMAYTAQVGGNLAGVWWAGGEAFPKDGDDSPMLRYPDSPIEPPYTAAWRTAYSAPEGGTFEGRGIGKRLAIAGLADVVALTKNGGPEGRPPLAEAGAWLETGKYNKEGQALYHFLGNTAHGQEPVGFVDVGIYDPPAEEGKPLGESRVGMIIGGATVQAIVENSGAFVTFDSAFYDGR